MQRELTREEIKQCLRKTKELLKRQKVLIGDKIVIHITLRVNK